jgi:DNA modification methylase
MKPYYEQDGITIYHGDTLDTLHALECSIDAVVTDPPYASGARTEAKKSSSGAMVRGQRWAAKPIENDQMTTTGFIWLRALHLTGVTTRCCVPKSQVSRD